MATEQRVTGGRPPRLTRRLIEEIVAGIITSAPREIAAGRLYVEPDVLVTWEQTAARAKGKPARLRSQHERLCVELFAKVYQAECEAAMNLWLNQASAAGLTRSRPKRRRTEQMVTGQDVVVDERGQVTGGRVTAVRIIEDEAAPNWRAGLKLGAARWPAILGPATTEAEAALPDQVTDEQLWHALERARDRAGIVIDVEGTEVAPAPPELGPASNGHEPAPSPGDDTPDA